MVALKALMKSSWKRPPQPIRVDVDATGFALPESKPSASWRCVLLVSGLVLGAWFLIRSRRFVTTLVLFFGALCGTGCSPVTQPTAILSVSPVDELVMNEVNLERLESSILLGEKSVRVFLKCLDETAEFLEFVHVSEGAVARLRSPCEFAVRLVEPTVKTHYETIVVSILLS